MASELSELQRIVSDHVAQDEAFQAGVTTSLQPIQRFRWWAGGAVAAILFAGGALGTAAYTLGPYAMRRAFDESIAANHQVQALQTIPARLNALQTSMEAYRTEAAAHTHPAPPPPPRPRHPRSQ